MFVSQRAVMKYLGARTNKILAYGVAAVSGTIFALCSCTIFPLFVGFYLKETVFAPSVLVPDSVLRLEKTLTFV